jgi:hypothetical protein
MDLNYYKTFITVSDDSPVSKSVVPQESGGKKTVAGIQYEMLANTPYVFTQEDVLFESWLRRQAIVDRSEQNIRSLRDAFFSKSQACLRASPLPKKYGFGFAFDDKGRVALVPMQSNEYRKLLQAGDMTTLKAMRSSR